MSYFDDVYLKRMNKDGRTQQERVETRKEIEFNELYLRKTQWQANIYKIDDKDCGILCSLQPNKWNESQLISNLLISKKCAPLKTGMVLRILQRIKEVSYDKIWLVLYCEEEVVKGYYGYKVICLDSNINITDEYGTTLYAAPVKFVNASTTFISDYFNYSNGGYREPNSSLRFIAQDADFLKKDVYFNLKDKRFQITGKDNISVNNVAYVSTQERLTREPELKSSGQIEVGSDKNFFLNNR